MSTGEKFIAILDIESSAEARLRIVDYYIEQGVIEAGRAYGLLEGALVRAAVPSRNAESPSNEERLRVVSIWPEAAAYQSWLDSLKRRDLIAGMDSLIEAVNGTTTTGPSLEDHFSADAVIHRVMPAT